MLPPPLCVFPESWTFPSNEEGCYSGTLKARVGPMSITLSGTVRVEEQDHEQGRARYLVEGQRQAARRWRQDRDDCPAEIVIPDRNGAGY